MSSLSLKNINKIYSGGVQAVFDANLEIEDGEFVVLVGPSGCGKSTLLRMIAGLEEITDGQLCIGERVVNNVAPADRDIAMVFQNYALYGHMTVYENMGLSLAVRHKGADYIHEEVMKASDVVELKDYLNRKPGNLSGGQRQRVALGRSIVRHAGVFLMDEPLSNLDAKLRTQTRRELVSLHNHLGTTFVYVTHDQVEAMTMADRIVILNAGIIQQVGTPKDVYLYPENIFVASFIGSPSMNFLDGHIEDGMFYSCCQKGNRIFELALPESKKEALKAYEGRQVKLGIRPEHITDEPRYLAQYDHATLEITTDIIEFLGSDQLVYFNIDDKQMVARVRARQVIGSNECLKLAIKMDEIHFFDLETERRIR